MVSCWGPLARSSSSVSVSFGGQCHLMKTPDDLDWIALERLYEEACESFRKGRHDEAVDRFKRIYEDTLELRDVAQVVDDYYGLPREQWIAKYQARFEK